MPLNGRLLHLILIRVAHRSYPVTRGVMGFDIRDKVYGGFLVTDEVIPVPFHVLTNTPPTNRLQCEAASLLLEQHHGQ